MYFHKQEIQTFDMESQQDASEHRKNIESFGKNLRHYEKLLNVQTEKF